VSELVATCCPQEGTPTWCSRGCFQISHASVPLCHTSPPRLHHPHWHRRRQRVTVFELLRDDYPFLGSFEFPLGGGQSRLVKKWSRWVLCPRISSPSIFNTLTVLSIYHITSCIRPKCHRCALRSPVLDPIHLHPILDDFHPLPFSFPFPLLRLPPQT